MCVCVYLECVPKYFVLFCVRPNIRTYGRIQASFTTIYFSSFIISTLLDFCIYKGQVCITSFIDKNFIEMNALTSVNRWLVANNHQHATEQNIDRIRCIYCHKFIKLMVRQRGVENRFVISNYTRHIKKHRPAADTTNFALEVSITISILISVLLF